MSVTAELKPMAKKMGRPKTSDRRDGTTKIDATVLGKAQMVAKAKGLSVAEYLSDICRGPVDRDFLKEMKRLDASEGKGSAE
jgi:hypothetical protein